MSCVCELGGLPRLGDSCLSASNALIDPPRRFAAGLRFVSTKGEKIDIVYGNIRHGIFQPCEKEHVVLLHFHLRHAIMVGKKKFEDIQFFTEVVEASQALDGRLRSDYDQDEFHAEERERKMRIELNRAFKKFVERVEEVAGGDPTNRGFSSFDVPQRDIGFSGAPFKEMSFIMPCSACLISVVDKPVGAFSSVPSHIYIPWKAGCMPMPLPA